MISCLAMYVQCTLGQMFCEHYYSVKYEFGESLELDGCVTRLGGILLRSLICVDSGNCSLSSLCSSNYSYVHTRSMQRLLSD